MPFSLEYIAPQLKKKKKKRRNTILLLASTTVNRINESETAVMFRSQTGRV